MSNTYFSLSLNLYKHACSNNIKNATVLYPRSGNFALTLSSGILILSCILADLGSVGVREVGISFLLLSALLAGLLLQHTLHTSVCFTSCNCSDPSVVVAGKSSSLGIRLLLSLSELCKSYEHHTKPLRDNGWYSKEELLPSKHCGSIHTALPYEVSKWPRARHHLR